MEIKNLKGKDDPSEIHLRGLGAAYAVAANQLKKEGLLDDYRPIKAPRIRAALVHSLLQTPSTQAPPSSEEITANRARRKQHLRILS